MLHTELDLPQKDYFLLTRVLASLLSIETEDPERNEELATICRDIINILDSSVMLSHDDLADTIVDIQNDPNYRFDDQEIEVIIDDIIEHDGVMGMLKESKSPRKRARRYI